MLQKMRIKNVFSHLISKDILYYKSYAITFNVFYNIIKFKITNSYKICVRGVTNPKNITMNNVITEHKRPSNFKFYYQNLKK